MTIEEAKTILASGKKLTHDYFSEGEYIYMVDGVIYSEDDVIHDNFWGLRQLEGWNNNWSIYDTTK